MSEKTKTITIELTHAQEHILWLNGIIYVKPKYKQVAYIIRLVDHKNIS